MSRPVYIKFLKSVRTYFMDDPEVMHAHVYLNTTVLYFIYQCLHQSNFLIRPSNIVYPVVLFYKQNSSNIKHVDKL